MRGIAPVVEMSLWHGTAGRYMTTSCSGGYEHYRVFHSANEFARGKSHVNGIENVQTSDLRGASPRGGL